MDRSDGLPERDRRLAMLSLMLAAAQVTLDISIVYTALPAIAADPYLTNRRAERRPQLRVVS